MKHSTLVSTGTIGNYCRNRILKVRLPSFQKNVRNVKCRQHQEAVLRHIHKQVGDIGDPFIQTMLPRLTDQPKHQSLVTKHLCHNLVIPNVREKGRIIPNLKPANPIYLYHCYVIDCHHHIPDRLNLTQSITEAYF